MEKILELMADMELEPPCAPEKLAELSERLGMALPEDYIRFMEHHDGGEGAIGKYGYLAVWGIDEVFSDNFDPEYQHEIDGLFCFASDRGGTIYAYDLDDDMRTIVEYFDDALDRSEVRTIARTFGEFIKYVYDIDDSEFAEG